MADAPERSRVFKLVNGRRTSKDIARETRRPLTSVSRDLARLRDGGLIQEKIGSDGNLVLRGGARVFEKVPLAKTISLSYFAATPKKRPATGATSPRAPKGSSKKRMAERKAFPTVPDERELLDVLRDGESQVLEFKAQGVNAAKIAKEAAAMLNTTQGGIILYGVDDEGRVQGSDLSRQALDQSLQNALRNTVDPAPVVKLESIRILGQTIIAIRVPRWTGRDVYHYEGRALLRKGTNTLRATAAEIRQLHDRKPVI